TDHRLRRLLRARRERPRGRRAAECDQQFPPSDGDCHTPLPCEVRKWNDTTPRWCSLPVQGGQDAGCFNLNLRPSTALLPSPGLCERRHRGAARRLVAVRGGAVLMLPKGQHPQPWLAYRRGRGPALWLERSRRAPALWRRGEVQLDRLAAGTRARLGGEFSGAGLKDQRRDLLGAVDADPGAEQPAARAVATGLVR